MTKKKLIGDAFISGGAWGLGSALFIHTGGEFSLSLFTTAAAITFLAGVGLVVTSLWEEA